MDFPIFQNAASIEAANALADSDAIIEGLIKSTGTWSSPAEWERKVGVLEAFLQKQVMLEEEAQRIRFSEEQQTGEVLPAKNRRRARRLTRADQGDQGYMGGDLVEEGVRHDRGYIRHKGRILRKARIDPRVDKQLRDLRKDQKAEQKNLFGSYDTNAPVTRASRERTEFLITRLMGGTPRGEMGPTALETSAAKDFVKKTGSSVGYSKEDIEFIRRNDAQEMTLEMNVKSRLENKHGPKSRKYIEEFSKWKSTRINIFRTREADRIAAERPRNSADLVNEKLEAKKKTIRLNDQIRDNPRKYISQGLIQRYERLDGVDELPVVREVFMVNHGPDNNSVVYLTDGVPENAINHLTNIDADLTVNGLQYEEGFRSVDLKNTGGRFQIGRVVSSRKTPDTPLSQLSPDAPSRRRIGSAYGVGGTSKKVQPPSADDAPVGRRANKNFPGGSNVNRVVGPPKTAKPPKLKKADSPYSQVRKPFKFKMDKFGPDSNSKEARSGKRKDADGNKIKNAKGRPLYNQRMSGLARVKPAVGNKKAELLFQLLAIIAGGGLIGAAAGGSDAA